MIVPFEKAEKLKYAIEISTCIQMYVRISVDNLAVTESLLLSD